VNRSNPEATKAIQGLQLEFPRLFNGGNYEALVNTHYTEDATFLPPGVPAVSGRAALRGFFQEMGKAYSNVRIAPGPVESSGDLAVAQGTYRADLVLPDGRKVEDRGKFLEGWRKTADGTWKCFADTFTSDLEHA